MDIVHFIIYILSENQRLKKEVIEDDLTGLYNRRFLKKRLKEEKSRAIRLKKKLQILFADVDGFKKVNDHLGHPAGDEVLKNIANILKSGARPYDIIARFGGDEFVLLLPDTSHKDAKEISKRLKKTVEKNSTEMPIPISISIGVTQFDENSKEDPLKLADEAMYKQKRRKVK